MKDNKQKKASLTIGHFDRCLLDVTIDKISEFLKQDFQIPPNCLKHREDGKGHDLKVKVLCSNCRLQPSVFQKKQTRFDIKALSFLLSQLAFSGIADVSVLDLRIQSPTKLLSKHKGCSWDFCSDKEGNPESFLVFQKIF